MWVATNDLPRSAAHPFYTRLNHVFEQHDPTIRRRRVPAVYGIEEMAGDKGDS
jgi:hypothetical protein